MRDRPARSAVTAVRSSSGPSITRNTSSSVISPGDLARWFTRRDGRLRLDLWSANRDQLIDAGVRPGRVFTCGLSTLAHAEVFDSYRAAGDRAGRMTAVIAVPSTATNVMFGRTD